MANANGDSATYANGVMKQFNEFLGFYSFKDDLYYHKNLVVYDSNDNIIDYDQLPLEIKKDISFFISAQKKSLSCFILKLNGDSDVQLFSNTLIWQSTKTDFIELATALYENNSISSETGRLSKKEFINIFANFFGIDLSNPEKILNKAMLREKPTQFIDKLKIRLTAFYDVLLNNTK